MPSPTAEPAPVRTVTVLPPQTSRETLGVVRAIGAIVIVGYFLIGLRRGGGEEGTTLLPYQALFRKQPAEIQRVYGDLVSGLEEMVRLRTPAGEWPSVERLAAELVPPFTHPPGRPPVYAWEVRRHKTYINYLGRPVPSGVEGPAARAGRPTFLLFIQEPDPEFKDVSHVGGAALDEFHRRLSDNTVLHVSIWFHPDPQIPQPLVWLPDREGWMQVVRGTGPTPPQPSGR